MVRYGKHLCVTHRVIPKVCATVVGTCFQVIMQFTTPSNSNLRCAVAIADITKSYTT